MYLYTPDSLSLNPVNSIITTSPHAHPLSEGEEAEVSLALHHTGHQW